MVSRHGHRVSLGVAWPGDKTTDTVPRLSANTVAPGPTNQRKNARPSKKSVATVEHLDISQKCAGKTQTTNTVTRLGSST